MDQNLKLLIFAVVLALGVGVIWWRLVKALLRISRPAAAAATIDAGPKQQPDPVATSARHVR